MADKKGAAKLAWVQERLAEGMTVYLSTYTRSTKITQRTWERFEDAGAPVLKVGSGDALLMAQGKYYVDASYSALRAN